MMQSPPPQPPQPPPQFPARVGAPRSAAIGCLHRGRAIFLLISTVCVGAVGFIALRQVAANLAREPELFTDVHGFALWVVEHRSYVVLAVVPPAIMAIWMMLRPARRSGTGKVRYATPWIAFGLASAWTLAIFAAIMITFIMCLAPLYQYRDL